MKLVELLIQVSVRNRLFVLVGVVVLPDHTFINGQRVKLDTGMHETCGRFGQRLAQVGVAGAPGSATLARTRRDRLRT